MVHLHLVSVRNKNFRRLKPIFQAVNFTDKPIEIKNICERLTNFKSIIHRWR